MSYADLMDRWHQQNSPNPMQRKWADEERAEDRARELLGELQREFKSLDTRPTSLEADDIKRAYTLLGQAPAWTDILRRATERADRALRRAYHDEAVRTTQAAREQED